MKALILASGNSSRMFPLTKEFPKALLKVNSETILDIEMGHLIDYGIKDVVITTGYQAEKIEKHIASNYSNVNITLVKNERYDTTNYIYSMWLARNFVNDDILLLHGDVVCEKSVLERLLMSEFPDAALVNAKIEAPSKDFKAEVTDNVIRRIGVTVSGKNAYFLAPIYKLTEASFRRWLDQIELFIEEGNVACYAEDAFNQVAHEITLKPVYYEDEFCMEIDTPDDLRIAAEYYRGCGRIND